jgi:hypothetical protein
MGSRGAAEPHLVGCWDSGRLERVLDSLLSNALNHTQSTGGSTAPEAGDRAPPSPAHPDRQAHPTHAPLEVRRQDAQACGPAEPAAYFFLPPPAAALPPFGFLAPPLLPGPLSGIQALLRHP